MERHDALVFKHSQVGCQKSCPSKCQSTTKDKGQKPGERLELWWHYGNKVMLKRRAERRDKESMIKSEPLIQGSGGKIGPRDETRECTIQGRRKGQQEINDEL